MMTATARHNVIGGSSAELTLSALPVTASCGHANPARARSDAVYCSNACRQAAYRARLRGDRKPRVMRPTPVVDYRQTSVDLAPAEPPAAAVVDPLGPLPSNVVPYPHEHSSRLCATCMAARHAQLAAAPRARVNPTAVAETIRRAHGSVWAAVTRYGMSYGHALRIRRGWRGDGRLAKPLRWESRGWTDSGQNGHSTRAGARLLHRYRVVLLTGAAFESRAHEARGASA